MVESGTGVRWSEDLPEATLAVVIAALIELVDVPSLVRLERRRSRRPGRGDSSGAPSFT
jgi:hypothetical protein